MIQIFNTQNEYDIYTFYNSYLRSDVLYYIRENGDVHFFTNNIDGEAKIYNKGNIPSGNIEITENGEDINVFSYASAYVNVPIPTGYILPTGTINITENSNLIDISSYAYAYVSVIPPVPTKETRLVVKYDVQSTEQATPLYLFGDPHSQPVLGAVDFSAIEIDGVDVSVETIDNNGGEYQFASTGEHTVKYTLNNGSISDYRFFFPQMNEAPTIPITSIFIPSDVTSIGTRAFNNWGPSPLDNWGGIETIIVDEDNEYYSSNGESGNCIVEKSTHTLLYISNNTVIPDDVLIISTYIGFSNQSITTFIIPNSVTTIGESVFYSSAISSLTVGSGVTTIGADSFSNCENLSTVTIYGTNDLSYDLPLSYVTTLYVDSSMIQTYEDAKEDMGYEYTVLPIPSE